MHFFTMTFGTTLGAPVRARSAENAARRVYGSTVTVSARASSFDGMPYWEVFKDGDWIDDVFLDA